MTWIDVQGQVQNFQNVHFQLRGFLDRSKLTMNKDVAPSAFPWRTARRLLATPPHGIWWRKRRCRWLWPPSIFYGSGIQEEDNPSVVWTSILQSMQWWSVRCVARRSSSRNLAAGRKKGGWLWATSIFLWIRNPGRGESPLSILQSMVVCNIVLLAGPPQGI